MIANPALQLDLIGIIEREGRTSLARMASTGSGEYAGSCPWCGGTDRFRVWPSSSRPHYWCRQCMKSGDAIQFMRDFCDISFSEACHQLGLDPDEVGEYEVKKYDRTADDPPCEEWQSIGNVLVQKAQQALWSHIGTDALSYLRKRGLTDETIKRAKLGYVPLGASGRWLEWPFETWGLSPESLTSAQLQKGCVRVPDGILIPWFESGTLWKLAIKRPGEKMDYGQILGSAEGLYNVDSLQPDRPAMLVEGEFDALSVQQEAVDVIGCVATGSATRGRLGRWVADLSMSSFVLQSYDDDEGGHEGALWWLERLPQAVRWMPWSDRENKRFKDANDMLRYKEAFYQFTGKTLRDWVETGIWALTDAITETVEQVAHSLGIPIVYEDDEQPVQQAEPIEVGVEYVRLSQSERVETPRGPGRLFEPSYLWESIQRNGIFVVLDSKPKGGAVCFQVHELQSLDVPEVPLQLAF